VGGDERKRKFEQMDASEVRRGPDGSLELVAAPKAGGRHSSTLII